MPKTHKVKLNNKNTRKNFSMGVKTLDQFERQVVVRFLEMLNLIKLYHWKTYSYSTHKATDELYSKLNENIDTFVEVLLGKRGDRVNLMNVKSTSLKDLNSVHDLKREMVAFKSYLVSFDRLPALMTMSNSDLLNIRDEILGTINQFLYLLTFTK